jgi:hypothetical protein
MRRSGEMAIRPHGDSQSNVCVTSVSEAKHACRADDLKEAE